MEERREDTGKMPWRASNPGESWRGGEGETRTITDGKHRNLNIGTESRVQISDALSKELHHPIMSKLWDSEAGPTYRQTDSLLWMPKRYKPDIQPIPRIIYQSSVITGQ